MYILLSCIYPLFLGVVDTSYSDLSMCPIGTLNSVHVSNSEFYQLHTVKLVYSKFTTEILWLTLLLLQINKEFVADRHCRYKDFIVSFSSVDLHVRFEFFSR